ncbi:MAG: asparaginase [Planctomycetota bacterium]|nr:asparaginase [Planctomycetota bacterium]
MSFGTVPLVDVLRGGILESQHRGAIAVVDASGKLVARAGDAGLRTFLRSSGKPFQALPLVESGAADRFNFTPEELAVCSASHSGEPRHLKVVRGILKKIGLTEAALHCGTHTPLSSTVAKALQKKGEKPGVLHHNCSGKHSGMLAACVAHGWPVESYTDPAHPLQQAIVRTLAELAEMPPRAVGVAIDGCSVPSFAMPLRHAALLFARWAEAARTKRTPPSRKGAPVPRAEALTRIAHAVLKHPGLIAGEARIDTDLIVAARGRVLCKSGAEGFEGVGVIVPPKGGPALGIAIKNGDGEGKRGTFPVVIETLKQLGVLDAKALRKLEKYHTWKVTNFRDLEVGEVVPAFKLR